MLPIDPALFLHPVRYHDGGVAFVPLAVLVVGVALLALGAWQLYAAAPGNPPERVEESIDA